MPSRSSGADVPGVPSAPPTRSAPRRVTQPAASSSLLGHVRVADVRGLTRLVGDATVGVTNIVEAVHESIVRPPWLLRGPRRGRTTGLTGFVYRCVRAATRLVGEGADAVLRGLTPAFRHGRSSPEREALLAILNGVLGDHLVASGNLLAIAMSLRSAGTSLQ